MFLPTDSGANSFLAKFTGKLRDEPVVCLVQTTIVLYILPILALIVMASLTAHCGLKAIDRLSLRHRIAVAECQRIARLSYGGTSIIP